MDSKLTINISSKLLESFRNVVGRRNIGKGIEELIKQELTKNNRKRANELSKKIIKKISAEKNKKSIYQMINEYKSERN